MKQSDGRGDEAKGAGSLSFHYDREERLRGRPEQTPRGGFLFRNRSLAIVVIDLLVVFVVFVLIRLFIFTGAGSASIGPFEVTLDAFAFDNEIYLTVTVTATEPVVPTSGEETLFEVTFPDDVTVTDLLPDSEGERTEVRYVVGPDESGGIQNEDGTVTVEVLAAGETIAVTSTVD